MVEVFYFFKKHQNHASDAAGPLVSVLSLLLASVSVRVCFRSSCELGSVVSHAVTQTVSIFGFQLKLFLVNTAL